MNIFWLLIAFVFLMAVLGAPGIGPLHYGTWGGGWGGSGVGFIIAIVLIVLLLSGRV